MSDIYLVMEDVTPRSSEFYANYLVISASTGGGNLAPPNFFADYVDGSLRDCRKVLNLMRANARQYGVELRFRKLLRSPYDLIVWIESKNGKVCIPSPDINLAEIDIAYKADAGPKLA